MQFLTALLANWRVVLLTVLLSIAAWHYNALVNDRDNAVSDLKEYIRLQTELSSKQEQVNQIKLIQAKNQINLEKLKAAQQLEQFGLDRVKLSNEMRKLYEGKITAIKRNMVLRSERMLQPSDSANQSTTPASDPRESTASESIDYASAYRTLEDACRVTTIDFNQARAWIDTACEMYECKD